MYVKHIVKHVGAAVGSLSYFDGEWTLTLVLLIDGLELWRSSLWWSVFVAFGGSEMHF